MKILPCSLLLATFLCGCGLPEKTVAVDTPEDSGKAIHQLLDGPDSRLKLVMKGTGTVMVTVQKKAGQVTVSPLGKPTITEPIEKVKKDLGQQEMQGCKSNLKNLATAAEMWSTDNAGRYPNSAAQLCPAYLKQIPTCPVAGKDTYSDGYVSRSGPDAYTFVCRGHHHAFAEVPEDYPLYNSNVGVVERP